MSDLPSAVSTRRPRRPLISAPADTRDGSVGSDGVSPCSVGTQSPTAVECEAAALREEVAELRATILRFEREKREQVHAVAVSRACSCRELLFVPCVSCRAFDAHRNL